jgi:hypothetical protein
VIIAPTPGRPAADLHEESVARHVEGAVVRARHLHALLDAAERRQRDDLGASFIKKYIRRMKKTWDHGALITYYISFFPLRESVGPLPAYLLQVAAVRTLGNLVIIKLSYHKNT